MTGTTPNFGFVVPNDDGTDLMDADLWRTPIGQIDASLKAKYDEVMNLIKGSGNVVKTGTDIGLVASSGWQFTPATNFMGAVRGGMASIRLETTKITSAIASTSDGNITNNGVATFSTTLGKAFLPLLGFGPLQSAHAGAMHASYVSNAGVIAIAALGPGAACNVNINDAVVFFGTYAVAF